MKHLASIPLILEQTPLEPLHSWLKQPESLI